MTGSELVVLNYGVDVPLTIPDGGVAVLLGSNTSIVTFAGSSGTLEINQPPTFGGTVQGFAAQNRIDLPTIAFGAQTTLAYAANSAGTGGGVLTVADGRHAAAIALLGNYMAASFVFADSYGGTLVTPAQQAEPPPLLTRPHPS